MGKPLDYDAIYQGLLSWMDDVGAEEQLDIDDESFDGRKKAAGKYADRYTAWMDFYDLEELASGVWHGQDRTSLHGATHR
jgi:hypothetical protein